eukprot:9648096-Alexandrium_andersonii.AAC.1
MQLSAASGGFVQLRAPLGALSRRHLAPCMLERLSAVHLAPCVLERLSAVHFRAADAAHFRAAERRALPADARL